MHFSSFQTLIQYCPSTISCKNFPADKSASQVISIPNTICKAKQNILFLKTHKTGSSSIQNIFLRYGDEHNLTFVLPKKSNYLGHPTPFKRGMVSWQQACLQYTEKNIFTHHARYNYEEMKSIMPNDTIFVTILRDPVAVTESVVSYFNIKKKYRENSTLQFLEKAFSSSVNRSAYHISLIERKSGKFGSNQMSFDLGFDPKYFDDLTRIETFIKTIDSQFHLVMITERMEESLIHLQNILCWTMNDVISFRHNVRNLDVSYNLSNDLKKRIRFYSKADNLLYKYFYAKLTRQTKVYGKAEMEKQITSLKHATKLMYKKCVEKEVSMRELGVGGGIFVHDSVLGLKQTNVMDEKCRRLTAYELVYTNLIRDKYQLKCNTSELHVSHT